MPDQKPLSWTKAEPTETGYYWHRRRKTLEIVRVIMAQECLAVKPGRDDDVIAVADMMGEWAGPIPYPEERQKK